MNKSSKNIFEAIRPAQVLVGVEFAEVGLFKGYPSHGGSSLRGVPYLEFKAALQCRTSKIISGSSDDFYSLLTERT